MVEAFAAKVLGHNSTADGFGPIVSNSLTTGSTVLATATDAVGNISQLHQGVTLNVSITNGTCLMSRVTRGLIAEQCFTLIPVKSDTGSSNQLVYDNNRAPMRT